MTSNSTKRPYCSRRYQQAAAYERHLQTIHRDIVLSLPAIADPTAVSPLTTIFVPDRSVGQIDSNYKFDLGLEIADCQVADEGMGDMQDDSDAEDISQPPARRRPSSQDTILGAGRPLGDVDNYRELNPTIANFP